MVDLLEKLGVPTDVRLFFAPYFRTDEQGNLLFAFGARHEHFGRGFHLVPNAIPPLIIGAGGRQTIVCCSAMEAIAFLSYSRYRFGAYTELQFVLIGNRFNGDQLSRHGKIALVFGNDLLGRLLDIKVAVAVAGKDVRLIYGQQRVKVLWPGGSAVFDEDQITLNAFERASGLRLDIRTYKPKGFNSFLEQLKMNDDEGFDQDTAGDELCRF